MKTIWVLVIVLHGWDRGYIGDKDGNVGNAIATVEFTSEENCMDAGSLIGKGTDSVTKTFCVKK